MEKALSSNVASLVDRRLHPVRLSIGHLNRILEGPRTGGSVTIDRDLLYSIVSTLEIFLEDFENYVMSTRPMAEEKRSMDGKIPDSPRVTQTRVG